MTSKSVLLVLAAASCMFCDDVRLDQSVSQVKKAAGNVKLSCTVSGFSLATSYMSWIRQRPGGPLEWIGNTASNYGAAFQGRFVVSENVSSETTYLQIDNLQAEDTAVYYCAEAVPITYLGRYYFDYWGKGTHVTVTSGGTAEISLFPLVACASEKPTDYANLACLATGFSDSVTFEWRDHGGNTLSEFLQYPSIKSHGTYTGVSQIRVSAADWNRRNLFKCSVKHSSLSSAKTVDLQKPVCITARKPCLEVTVKPPRVKEMFINNNAVLECEVTGAERKEIEGATVSWTVDGTTTNLGITGSVSGVGRLFRKNSILTLPQSDWFSGKTVECSVNVADVISPPIRNPISIGHQSTFQEKHTKGMKEPSVHIYQLPEGNSNDDIRLVCLVTDFFPSDVYVMWWANTGEKMEGDTSAPVAIKNGDTYMVSSVFQITREMWNREGTKVTCGVKHASNVTLPFLNDVSKASGNAYECE